jgi:hypothetical protein
MDITTTLEVTTPVVGVAIAALAVAVPMRSRREERRAAEQRERDAHREREDEDARQVAVKVRPWPSSDGRVVHMVTISTPHTYPIKPLEGWIASTSDGNPWVGEFYPRPRESSFDENWTRYRYPVERLDGNSAPIVSFANPSGKLYWCYQGNVRPFAPGTSAITALQEFDRLARTT